MSTTDPPLGHSVWVRASGCFSPLLGYKSVHINASADMSSEVPMKKAIRVTTQRLLGRFTDTLVIYWGCGGVGVELRSVMVRPRVLIAVKHLSFSPSAEGMAF